MVTDLLLELHWTEDSYSSDRAEIFCTSTLLWFYSAHPLFITAALSCAPWWPSEEFELTAKHTASSHETSRQAHFETAHLPHSALTRMLRGDLTAVTIL